MCSSPTSTACLDSDSCVDLVDDPANCGACGRACAPTATCRRGVCGPPSATLVVPAPGCGELDLAIDGATLYWTDRDHGVVSSLTLPGGTAKSVAPTEHGARLATASGTRLVWVDVASTMQVPQVDGVVATQTTVVLRALAGGTPVDLATESNINGGIRGLAVSADGATVFYSADTNVRAVPAAGGFPIDVAHEALDGVPTVLALAGNEIAFPVDLNGVMDVITIVDGAVASCGNNSLAKGPLDLNCTRLARGLGELFFGGVALHGGYAYWAEGAELERNVVTGPENVFAVNNGPLDVNDDGVTTFVGGSDGLYVGTGSQGTGSTSGAPAGLVVWIAYQQGAIPVALARGDGAPRSIALDAGHVYWSTDDCGIYSVAR